MDINYTGICGNCNTCNSQKHIIGTDEFCIVGYDHKRYKDKKKDILVIKRLDSESVQVINPSDATYQNVLESFLIMTALM